MNDTDHSDIPVLADMRAALVDGVRREATRPPGRRIGRVAVVAASATALAAALAFVFGLGPIGTNGPTPAAAFSVEVEDDGRIHVTMHQGFDQADRLADELRNAGVDVRVLPHPAHPMLVGTVEFPSHQLADIGVERGDREFWIDPDEFDGEIEMLVYVAPDPGEEWLQAPSVFHPDEPLGGLPCVLDGPMTTEELQRRARSVGIDEFTWIVLSPIGGDPREGYIGFPADIGPNDPAPPGEVEEAHRVGPNELSVSMFPPEVVAEIGPTATPSMNLNVGDAPEPECTPELRARWEDG